MRNDDPKCRTHPVTRQFETSGAYYTDSQVAEFLVWWGVRRSSDTVLDPNNAITLDQAFAELLDIIAERDPDFYEVIDGKLEKAT